MDVLEHVVSQAIAALFVNVKVSAATRSKVAKRWLSF
jgi:hypothetical protein